MLFALNDCKVDTVDLKVKLEKSRPEHVLRNSDLEVTRCVVTNLIILMTVIFLIVAKQRLFFFFFNQLMHLFILPQSSIL